MVERLDEPLKHSWEGPPLLAVILGDFGRAATVRFASSFSDAERKYLLERLPEGTRFYDEYRRVSIALHGDLSFVKESHVAPYLERGLPFDERVLVGFPGGLTTDQVEARMGVLALEAMAGAVRRGILRILVLIPCNTLAPVSWSLNERFGSDRSLLAMLEEAGSGARSDLRELVPLISACQVSFPTVPEAVVELACSEGAGALLPLGTTRIAPIYEEAIGRTGRRLTLEKLADDGQATVLEAITNAIDASGRAWDDSKRALEMIERHAREGADGELAVVSACTDLDYGVGIDSEKQYARYAVKLAYG